MPTHTPTPALGDAVLPRASKSCSDRQDPIVLHSRNNVNVELRITVKDQESVRLVITPGLAKLQRRPKRIRILSRVEMQDSWPVVIDHEEAVENTKCQRGHGKEVHRCDHLSVVPKKHQ